VGLTPPTWLAGDICSICIDEFSAAVVAAAAVTPAKDAVAALRATDPPAVALRCGHVLHVACAEQAVAAVPNRHMRCPLCREPATLAGAASARVFS
jgi:hypothetical protein